jgi:hypothetical protein
MMWESKHDVNHPCLLVFDMIGLKSLGKFFHGSLKKIHRRDYLEKEKALGKLNSRGKS